MLNEDEDKEGEEIGREYSKGRQNLEIQSCQLKANSTGLCVPY